MDTSMTSIASGTDVPVDTPRSESPTHVSVDLRSEGSFVSAQSADMLQTVPSSGEPTPARPRPRVRRPEPGKQKKYVPLVERQKMLIRTDIRLMGRAPRWINMEMQF